jgi:MazG family protein
MNPTSPGSAGTAFEALVEVMRRLRAPDGCPWDREQTLQTLKTYVIEEAYEVIQAIDDGKPAGLKEELGDLLLQVVFQAQLMSEAGEFDAGDVCRSIVDKLVARHPHVFVEGQKARDAADVLSRWEGYKKKEGRGLLAGVPDTLPALLMALRISDKVRNVGFDWPDAQGAVDKLDEEVAELKEAIASGDTVRVEEEMGDVLFTVANLARLHRLNPEESLRRMLGRFRARFSHMEAALKAQGLEVKGTPLQTLDVLWQQAKQAESGSGFPLTQNEDDNRP